MRQTIDKYEKGDATITIVFDSGGPVGGDHLVIVDGEEYLVNRWFYFDEFDERYAKNFAEKIVTDPAYREASLEGTADWAQIADIYEPAARRIYEVFNEAGLLGYRAGNAEERDRYLQAQETMEDLCRDVFQEVRGRIRESQSLDELDTYIDQRVAAARDTVAEHS